jgi:hypothetical protein
MHVEMIDGLAAVFACIDDDAIALRQSLLACKTGCDPQQVTEKRGMSFAGFSERDEMLTRSDQQVDRRLGMNVCEGVALIVLIFGGGWDASFDNFAEEAAHDRTSVQDADC